VQGYSNGGQLLAEFSSRIKPSVAVTPHAFKVHGISNSELCTSPSFVDVIHRLNQFLESSIPNNFTGILVAFNGNVCDFSFLAYELERNNLALSPSIKYTVDPLSLIRRFKSNPYALNSPTEWKTRTPKNKPSLVLSAVVTHGVLRNTSSFETECGRAHDAMADAKGVALVWFDKRFLNQQMYRQRRIFVSWDAWAQKARLGVKNRVDTKLKVKDTWEEHELNEGPHHETPFDTFAIASGISASLKIYLDTMDFNKSAADTMLHIFLYFFDLDVLDFIVQCTNAHARQRWVYYEQGGKTQKRAPRTEEEAHNSKPAIKNYVDMTIGSLLTWLGIAMVMGCVGHHRPSHYWSDEQALGNSVIKSAMTFKCWKQFWSQLSFYDLDEAESSLGNSKLKKISQISDMLNSRCKRAFTMSENVVIDESMIKCKSKYCGFKQHMRSKPIKSGVKVFCLVDSTHTYLWNWNIFGGKTSSDEDPSDGFIHNLVTQQLIPETMNHQGYCVFLDNYFSSESIASSLAARGIRVCGTCRTTPFDLAAKGCDNMARGWMRQASKKTETGHVIQSTLWKDNKLVKFISTAFINEAADVKRWDYQSDQKIDLPCVRAIKEYNKFMGGVDKMDRNVAHSRLFLKSRYRYHRQIFLWLLAAIGINNTMAIFEQHYPDAKTFRRMKDQNGIGFRNYFQLKLGEALIEFGEFCWVLLYLGLEHFIFQLIKLYRACRQMCATCGSGKRRTHANSS
jgi:DNA polymerase III epsilon subunit-like protein